MEAGFSVVVAPHIDLVRIVLSGFFTPADIEKFVTHLADKTRALRCLPNEHVTLCDVSAMKIQAQETVACFAQVVGHPRFRSRRLAFATGSSLARLQANRLTDREGVAFFRDAAEAQAWLLAA